MRGILDSRLLTSFPHHITSFPRTLTSFPRAPPRHSRAPSRHSHYYHVIPAKAGI